VSPVKNIFINFLAIFFPWIVFLIYDNPGAAFIALIMQTTIIGWIPASIWAWQTIHPKKKTREKEHE
jgi:uncharacterized membrane protein YqaE (UPF0057 family)